MAMCEVCAKTRAIGFNVSHSKRHTKRSWEPNIQRATIYENGKGRQVYICTRCLRNTTKAA